MKNSTLRFVLALVSLVFALAGEELLPKMLGVGFPLLLSLVIFFASRATVALGALVALVAGAGEDALSGLPFFTSVSYFLLVGALVRGTRLPLVIAPLAYPVYQLWLFVWTTNLLGSVFTRFLVAFPIGALTAWVVTRLLIRIERKAAFDETA